jgi:MFS family permease
MALFCVQIDYFAVNLALPRMAADLHTTTTDLQWVISVYMLTLGAFMVPAGRIGDIFGRRRALLAGIALFAVVSLILGALAVPETFDDTVLRRLDLVGLALITTGVGVFTLTVDRAPSWGWTSVATIGAFAASVALLAFFVVVERRTRWPLLNLSLLSNGRFVILVAAGTVANVAYAVTVFLSTLNLQQVHGLTPLVAGLLFLGPSAGAALGGVISGRLATRHSPITVMGVGCTAAALSLGLLAAAANPVLYVVALTAVSRWGWCTRSRPSRRRPSSRRSVQAEPPESR